jgi:hypothetical protein
LPVSVCRVCDCSFINSVHSGAEGGGGGGNTRLSSNNDDDLPRFAGGAVHDVDALVNSADDFNAFFGGVNTTASTSRYGRHRSPRASEHYGHIDGDNDDDDGDDGGM